MTQPTARQSAHAAALARNVEIRRAYGVEEFVTGETVVADFLASVEVRKYATRRYRRWRRSLNRFYPRVGARAGD